MLFVLISKRTVDKYWENKEQQYKDYKRQKSKIVDNE